MRSLIRKLEPVLQLTRVTAAFAAVANVWFVILWTWANPNEGHYQTLSDKKLWLLLLGGACAAIGLSAFGAALNDFLDANRDRALGLDRPLAVGSASPELALSAVAGTLIFAALGATAFGMPAVIVTLLLAALIIAFNTAARFVPGVGFVVLGVIYAVQMMVPNLWLEFLAPVWLVMTHAIVVAGLTHWLARKSPTISRRAVVVGVLGWAMCSLVLLAVAFRHAGSAGVWPAWVPLTAPVFPGVLVVAFAFLAIRRISSLGSGVRSAEKIRRYGALWMPLYACAWLFGSGHFDYAALMGAVALAGFLGMTALREAYTMLEHPVGYRR
ncbi:MAG: hypothetical protein DHS20C14_00040 [Phycisphaeraceae bacterium]|nr:MAG: hypothetical protein DHS20C14_00040 [Phycisphaeraceae bacterium]